MKTKLTIILLLSSFAVAMAFFVTPANAFNWPQIPESMKDAIKKAGSTKQTNTTDKRDFEFIFKTYIGVTQWHGKTAYQNPHTGIDFGAVKAPIYAPANGYIKAIGWDNFSGKCQSGGNYVRIVHDNGMQTVYFHLKDYTKDNGKKWKIGERILVGQKVGTSGNTGKWKCLPLGYHLHFEMRMNSHQSSHVNPVPYMNVDWDKIPTIGYQNRPNRLTGDNPHPLF